MSLPLSSAAKRRLRKLRLESTRVPALDSDRRPRRRPRSSSSRENVLHGALLCFVLSFLRPVPEIAIATRINRQWRKDTTSQPHLWRVLDFTTHDYSRNTSWPMRTLPNMLWEIQECVSSIAGIVRCAGTCLESLRIPSFLFDLYAPSELVLPLCTQIISQRPHNFRHFMVGSSRSRLFAASSYFTPESFFDAWVWPLYLPSFLPRNFFCSKIKSRFRKPWYAARLPTPYSNRRPNNAWRKTQPTPSASSRPEGCVPEQPGTSWPRPSCSKARPAPDPTATPI